MVSQTRDHAPRNTVRHRSAKRDPHRDDEGTAFVKLARHILGRAPSLRAVTHDTALRGSHRTPLIADSLVVFTTQHGGLKPESLQRFVKGPCRHDLYVVEGRVCKRLLADDGTTYYTPLCVQELERRESRRTRFHHRLVIACQVEDHVLRIRVDETSEDREIDPSTKRQRFNRTEHLRQIPPDTHASRRLKGFRQDSESQRSRFDQSYPSRNMPAERTNRSTCRSLHVPAIGGCATAPTSDTVSGLGPVWPPRSCCTGTGPSLRSLRSARRSAPAPTDGGLRRAAGGAEA